jgi:hypothetical protein
MNASFMRPLIFIVIIQVFFSIPVRAQSKPNTIISGKVFDKSTREPLEYATISIINKQSGKTITGTVADVKGAFSISNIPFDTYQVNIEFIGYEKTTLDNIVLSVEKRSVSIGTIFLS